MADKSASNKCIVITGASSGFGKGTATALAREGASLVLAARRTELLEELVSQCISLGGNAMAIPTDVSRLEDVENLADTTIATFGRIDVWINNAGAGAVGRFEEVPIEDHIQVINTDLLGTMYGSYFAMQQFHEQGYGTLINVASVIGKVPAPYFASYAAAKHGVVGLSAALRQELIANELHTIHVCTVMPTSMDTPFFEHASSYSGHEAVPIPPVYDPQEVIDVLVRLTHSPEDEVSVGTAGKFMTFLHQFAPGLAEAAMRRETHKAELVKSPPAPETEGSVREPSFGGTTVRGGWAKKKKSGAD